MEAVLLGCGAAATMDRNYTSLLVRTDEREFLLDCNGSPINAMLRAGTDPLKVSAVLFTHSHIDHTYALPILIHEFMLRRRNDPLGIFFPCPDEGRVKSVLNGYFTAESLGFQVSLFPVEMEERKLIMDEGEFRLWGTPVEHNVPTLAYKFVQGEKALVYAPDTRPCRSLVKFAANADALFLNCTYLNGNEIAQKTRHSTLVKAMAAAVLAKVSKLILVHLAPEADEELSQALIQGSTQIVVGHDLLTVEI